MQQLTAARPLLLHRCTAALCASPHHWAAGAKVASDYAPAYSRSCLHSSLHTHLQVYGRAVRIATSLGGWIAKVASDYALGAIDANAALRAVELRTLLSGLGPSFVKIGQALSARPDLLPQVYLETLADLQVRLFMMC